VQIYNAIVTGTKPIGFFRAFRISSSIFDSVFAARRLKELRIIEIMKPLNKKAKRITPKEEIIAPRLIPRKPLDQTSLTNNIKFSIFFMVMFLIDLFYKYLKQLSKVSYFFNLSSTK
jgi:hypothetical protein